MATKGQYYKAVGADWGMLFNGKRWESFECLGCMYARKMLRERMGTNNVPTKVRLAAGKNFVYRHDPQLHNAWLKAGKPVEFSEE